MFSRALENLSPWTDRGMFENVIGCSFRDGYSDQDNTMTAVAKALLSRRLGPGEEFKIRISNIEGNEQTIEDPKAQLEVAVYHATDGDCTDLDKVHNMVIFSQFRYGGGEDFIRLSDAIENIMPTLNGWKFHGKAEVFLNKEMKARVLIQEEHRAAIVVTDKLTMPHWHLLGSMFPTYVPSLFPADDLKEDEKLVLKQLALHGAQHFIAELAKLEDYYDIRGQKIRQMIGGFEVRQREQQIRMIENEITNIRTQMENLMQQYSNYCEKLDTANVRRNGLKYLANETGGDDDLVNFFQANKCLDVIEVYGSRISFVVRTYFENFDSEMYERCRTNDRFIMESEARGVFSDPENRKKIMDAMFLSEKIKLRMCALFHLDVRGTVSTTTGYDFPANCSDYIPNYHLNNHHCFGNYERVITEYLQNGDTIGAVNACIASAKSVNIAESGPTFNPMMVQVFNSTKKCFELPDGTCVTPAKALEWLNEQEG